MDELLHQQLPLTPALPYLPGMHDGNVVASRHLDFTPNDGSFMRKVRILLSRPHSPVHRENEWIVDIEIEESFKAPVLDYAIGSDPFQALFLAMCKVGDLLKPWRDAGELKWGDSADLGLPSLIHPTV